MNTNEITVVSNQYAGDAVAAQTPLHNTESTSVKADAGVQLTERVLTGQIVLRVRGDLTAASTAIKSVLGIDLPDTLKFSGNPASSDGPSLLWVSPDEWRLCCPIDQAFEIEKKIRDALSSLTGVTHALTNNSGGFTILDISGPNAVQVLKKSTGYDVREKNFPVGKVVGTTFGKTTVQLFRTAEQGWQIIVRRSFADYLWSWLQHAM